MKLRLLRAAPLALLAGCADPVENGAPAGEEVEQAPLPAPSTIVGEWRVADIDGEPIDAAYAIALSVSREVIKPSPVCFEAWRWSYAYAGGRLHVEALQHPPAAIIAPPCDKTLSQLAAALDVARKVGRTPENGVRLSGGGRSVLLFSQ